MAVPHTCRVSLRSTYRCNPIKKTSEASDVIILNPYDYCCSTFSLIVLLSSNRFMFHCASLYSFILIIAVAHSSLIVLLGQRTSFIVLLRTTTCILNLGVLVAQSRMNVLQTILTKTLLRRITQCVPTT